MPSDRFRLNHDVVLPSGDIIPIGSVFKFEKIEINRATTEHSSVYLVFIMSSDPQWGMIKWGGARAFGRRIYMTYAQVRALDVDLVEGMC